MNFSRLGFHPGFALTYTLPELVGIRHARRLFYTGCRIDGAEAAAIGLADECVPQDEVRSRALELAEEIASSAPLAVRAIKATLGGDRLDRLRRATDHELAEQVRLLGTDDARRHRCLRGASHTEVRGTVTASMDDERMSRR